MIKIAKIVLFLVLLTIATLVLSQNVYASGNVFEQLLTDEKLVVHSVKPTDISTAWAVVYENTIMPVDEKYYLDWSTSFNEDFTTVTIYYGNWEEGDPSREVEIEYVYDEDVKAVIDPLVEAIKDKETFDLNEIEFINYLLNESSDASMANYSSELRKSIGYKNFSIDVRMGDDSPFLTEKGGNALFTYDNTVYYIKGMTTARAKHIIYINNDETDVLKAIKQRLNTVFGNDFNVTETGTVEDFLASERQSFIDRYAEDNYTQQMYNSADEYAEDMMNQMYYDEDGWYSFVTDANVYEKYYTLTIKDEEVTFLVVKDSSKVNNSVSLITSDVGSDITISANTAMIPLDTLIKALKVTSGDEYERIIEILKVTNSEMFDLKLYSSSTKEYITELPNGTFEVRIPVNETLEGKDIVVYYVDEDNNIVTYQVEIENGYAVFTTDHFSIYTIAEKASNQEETETPAENTNEPSKNEEKEETEKDETKNEYKILDGNNQKVDVEEGKDLTVRASGDIENFVSLKMDGKEINKENYTIKPGSTIATLKSTYLATLTKGEHTLTFSYTDGEVDAKLTVEKAEKTEETKKETNNPKTEDGIIVYMLIFVITSIGVVVYNKKF